MSPGRRASRRIRPRKTGRPVDAAIEGGEDVATCIVVQEWDEPRRVVDGQRGRQPGFAIQRVKQLSEAYRNHDLQQGS
jgi:hypothetical protein